VSALQRLCGDSISLACIESYHRRHTRTLLLAFINYRILYYLNLLNQLLSIYRGNVTTLHTTLKDVTILRSSHPRVKCLEIFNLWWHRLLLIVYIFCGCIRKRKCSTKNTVNLQVPQGTDFIDRSTRFVKNNAVIRCTVAA